LRARQLDILQELADIGMQIARAVRDECLAPLAVDEASSRGSFRRGGDPGLVFSRVARAVRQTLALQTRIFEGASNDRRHSEQQRVGAIRLAADERQEEIRDYVAQAIDDECRRTDASETEVERLLDDLDERLEDGRYDDMLADAPVAELVQRICFDLGLTPDWRIWKELEWGAEYLRAHLPEDVGAERWADLVPIDPPPAEHRRLLDSS
jgi:hypothetical protein